MSKTLLACLLVVAGCGGMAQTSGESSASSAVSCPATVPAWAAGTAYSVGTLVSYNGKIYQCVQAHTALSNWTPDAVASLWTQVSCSSGGGTSSGGGGGGTSSGGGTTSGGGACGATPWVQGANYVTGNIVSYQGADYIATHDNPGFSPTISTWYWSPYTCSSGGGGSSCNAPAWVLGANYVTGNVVSYQGAEYICTNPNPGYSPTISTWFWSPYSCSGGGGAAGSGGGGGGGGTTSGGSGLASILSESQFNSMFPNRNPFYTYQGLVNATASYGTFATSGASDVQKREVAALLANVAQETGSLVYVEEIAKDVYCQSSSQYPCASGQEYYGRGPLQISWNFNYGAAGAALNLPLLTNPGLVASDATVAWQTALWFWMTSTGAGSQTCHNAIVNGSGFGATIQTINGSIECNGGNPGEVSNRVQFFQKFCSMLGVDPGANISC